MSKPHGVRYDPPVGRAQQAVEAAENLFFDRCERMEVTGVPYALLCMSKAELELVIEALQTRRVVGARVLRTDMELIVGDLTAIVEEEDG
jgi:hypothetical protein